MAGTLSGLHAVFGQAAPFRCSGTARVLRVVLCLPLALGAPQAALAAGESGAAVPQPVQVPSLDAPSGRTLMLPAFWMPVPRVSAAAPAMLLLHGCGGPLDKRGRLAARTTELAARLNTMGVHVLATDSLSPRGERELCTQRTGTRSVTQLHRRRDALGALEWLARHPGVDAARLGVLGWSNGGSTVLAATNTRHDEVDRAAVKPSLAVAFYPGCRAELERGYRPVAPLLMLLGEADDWTPAAECKALAAAAERLADVPVPEFEAYAGAHHGFDGKAPVRLRRDVPNGVNPGQGVHVGGQSEARAAAAARLEQFLRRAWGLAP